MNDLKVRAKLTVVLLLAAVAIWGVFSVSNGSGTASHRARHVQLLASSVGGPSLYVQFKVTSDTRGVLEGNDPSGFWEQHQPFSREYWLYPQEKLTIKFLAGVNKVDDVVSCFVQTDNGVAAHDRHVVKERDTHGAVPMNVNCSTSVINI